jgi:NitT/TauT family transport system permease protein
MNGLGGKQMKKWSTYLSPLILPVVFLVFWQVSAVRMDNMIILPKVNDVFAILLKPTADLLNMGTLLYNVLVSLIRVGLGYCFAALIAIPLGLLIGYWRRMENIFMTFLNLFRPIAPLAWVPLVLAWFGVLSLSDLFQVESGNAYVMLSNIKASMIFIIFIGAFFPILTNSIYGVQSIRKILIDSAITLGAQKRHIFMKVLLPGALPSIVTGLRVGLGIAWMCLVSAEMLPGSIAGVGYLITHAYTIARTDVVIAGMIAISAVGGLFDLSFRMLEKRFFTWQSLSK